MSNVYETEYKDLFAEFYDAFFTYNDDAYEYADMLHKYGNNVLELGCGTGRISIVLADNGYKVTGLDNELCMINRLKAKKYNADNLVVKQADVKNFQLDKKFDVILLSNNFITEFTSYNDIVRILNNCANNLENNGVIIIEACLPNIPEMVECNNKEEILTVKVNNNVYYKDYYKPVYDFVNGLETDYIKLEKYVDDKLHDTAETISHRAFYMAREIEEIISLANLHLIKSSGSVSTDTKISAESNKMIFTCGL